MRLSQTIMFYEFNKIVVETYFLIFFITKEMFNLNTS